MDELRVLIEATKATYIEHPAVWFDLPVDELELEELLGVEADSKDYRIIEKEVPFPDDVTEETTIDTLNDLYRMYEDLPSAYQDELEELLTHFTSLEELYQHRYDIIHYADCNSMIDVARRELAENPAFNALSEDCVRYFDFEAYGQSLNESGKVSGNGQRYL